MAAGMGSAAYRRPILAATALITATGIAIIALELTSP
jgi:hypothetical protein